ncbi:MAG: hypothetical protein GX649_17500 [Chloroflexi bacterium]|nr:hypothetical protein [Chloroflexota bacterium]
MGTSGDMGDAFGSLCGGGIISILIAIGVFFILRELVCWYWKLNELVRLQEAQLTALKAISEDIRTLLHGNEGKLNEGEQWPTHETSQANDIEQ